MNIYWVIYFYNILNVSILIYIFCDVNEYI